MEDSVNLSRRVLREEAAALTALAASLNGDFSRCVETVFHSTGRVAVTGIGKSGHVARKISATLNSTGTPSYFIHPSEASHGDLGCMLKEDALLALSNSGESSELGDILAFAARRSIPVIAMTKNPNSFLGRQAACVLLLPDMGEAGPLGCAPTTSTTMMMALGDALAMALLQLRGFTAEDFAHFHPGGQLGRKLMLVRNIMHTNEKIPLTDKSTPMSDALCIMTGKGFGCVGVTEKSRLMGVISDGDLRRHMSNDLLNKTAVEIMTPHPMTIEPDAPAAKALGLMNARHITSLFVVDNAQTAVGIVHMHDCLRAGLE
jgi:arabinose-5-phosphate isomerase